MHYYECDCVSMHCVSKVVYEYNCIVLLGNKKFNNFDLKTAKLIQEVENNRDY